MSVKAVLRTLMKSTPGVNFTNILGKLFCKYFCGKKLESRNMTRDKLCETLSFEKFTHKMLMKLTPACFSYTLLNRYPQTQPKQG